MLEVKVAAKSLQSCPTLCDPIDGRQPTRLLCPWDSPGKNTGVGCHFLLQCMKVKSESEVAQSCLTLSDPMDCSLPGSSVHGIFQARVLEWVAISTGDLPDPGIKPGSPTLQADPLPSDPLIWAKLFTNTLLIQGNALLIYRHALKERV